MTPAFEDSIYVIAGDDEKKNSGYSMGRFIADTLQTRACRNTLDSLISNVLAHWSKEHAGKKAFARLYRVMIGKRLAKPVGTESEDALSRLFESPEFLERAGKAAPDLMNGAIGILHAATNAFEHLPEAKKKKIVGDFLSDIDTGKIAEILTSLFRTAGSLRSDNPRFFTEKIIPQIQSWLDHTDFGELRELFDNSKEDYDALIVQLCELAFEYPAKFIIFLSYIPGIANFAILLLAEMTKRFNALSPDMLADILLSFFRELDGDKAGDLLNNLAEIVRQIHTGSALVGESGAPRFTMDLSGKTRAVLKNADPALFIKARNALIDGKETIAKVFMDVAAENPEFLVQQLRHIAVRQNSKSRLVKRKIELVEDLPEEVTIQALETGLASWATYDLADILNSLCRMANTLYDGRPEVLVSKLREFTGALDLYEIEKTVGWFAAEIGHSFRPLARTVFPVLVQEFCDFFTPEDDGQDQEIQEARKRLRNFVLNEEERSWV
ncbi:MAG: hypothetical protein ACOZF0_12995 [Thermodesulfobacteriota bacterium]